MKIIRKIILITIFIFVLILTGCLETPTTINNEIVVKEDETISLKVGEIIKLESKMDSGVWSSSNPDIAKVDASGMVYALKEGNVTITIKNSESEKSISIHVEKVVEEVSLVVSGKQTILVGETTMLTPNVNNSFEPFTFTFETNDEKVATVSSDGVVTGVSTGICTITVKAIATSVYTKEVLIYVKEENDNGEVINNVINNVTYQVVGSFDLSMINNKITELVSNIKESVVGVSNYQYQIVQGTGNKTLIETSIGTGFIYKVEKVDNTNKYYVLTNYHVVENNEKLKIFFGYEDAYVDATLVSGNDKLDLAVVSFTSDKEYKLVPLGATDKVNQGDFAVAIGNANGYEYFGSVTLGVISYVNRKLTGEDALFLQHDVAINPGNSGEVIGVNTLKIVDTDIDNMGFSISIDVVKNYLTSVGLN